jgi:uncharacterized membrane protein
MVNRILPLGPIDFWILAMTLLTDMSFLAIYSFFKSTRAFWVTLVILLLEVVGFAIGCSMQNDAFIDSANIVFALMTSLLGLILWSGRLSVINGETRFCDYYEKIKDIVDSEVETINLETRV